MIKYKQGFKYQLYEDYFIQLKKLPQEQVYRGRYLYLDETGLLTIANGYCWDGPSGPTIDSKNFMRGSLVHDALYQLIRWGDLPENDWREYADDVLRKICLEDGMSRFRAWYVYKSVRGFGGMAVQKPKKVLIAPDLITSPSYKYEREYAW